MRDSERKIADASVLYAIQYPRSGSAPVIALIDRVICP